MTVLKHHEKRSNSASPVLPIAVQERLALFAASARFYSPSPRLDRLPRRPPPSERRRPTSPSRRQLAPL